MFHAHQQPKAPVRKESTMRSLLVALSLAAASLPGVAHAWWDQGWSYRKPLTLDTTTTGVNVVGEAGRVPMLVRLHDGNMAFSDINENGADLRFIAEDDKTPLTYHIESFDGLLGVATIWVDVPALAGGAQQKVWMYFGNKEAPAAVDTPGTYDPNTLLVYHFDDQPGQPTSDKTAYKNNAQNGPAAADESAIIGRGAKFEGGAPIVVEPKPALALAAGSPLTVSLWAKEAAPTANSILFTRGSVVIGLAEGVPYATVGAVRLTAPQAVQPNQWANLAVTADGTTLALYVNGKQAVSAPGTTPAMNDPIYIGGTQAAPFTGSIDELRILKVAVSPATIQAENAFEGAESPLLKFGEDEEQGEGGGVLGYIVSHTPAADWVVIVICMLMLSVAAWVMWSKGAYLGMASKANTVFMKHFRRMTGELHSIERQPDVSAAELKKMKNSPLFRLYETGVEELEIRMGQLRGRSLSSENVEAIRAAIDATQVEENQKLDSLMVLLTIAIAGGPFIGLLGTVIGVMKTFGGVALAGDVNVNAIAPGIAAALLATVAGLACAIPALFGYNYLNSQISTLSDQMRIFVDRLVTRLAEQAAHEAAPPPQQLAAE